LLHATLKAATDSGLTVHALHVHHGLNAQADRWLDHCQAQCARWAKRGWPVVFHAERLGLRPARGESVEALARTARYAALKRLAVQAGASLVLLAHHRRDQAETLLLQALRGAGAAGLAAMPASIEREGITWVRPWLAQPREAIDAYVARYRLPWIDDDSNADPRFARNRLRLLVWPALTEAFPQAEASLAHASVRAQEASACAADLAVIDLSACAGKGALSLGAWRQLPPHRASNALRAWLKAQSGSAPSAALADRLMNELQQDGPACWPLGGGELRRYRGALTWRATSTRPATPREASLSIRRAGRYPLPGWAGVLVVRKVEQGGVLLRRLAPVELVARQGGERYQPAPDRPARALKKQYQAAAVPAWARQGPLLWASGELLFVPGLGINARALAQPGEAQVSIAWEPLPSP
jgi:tRNA(Ile)-lysidine synthase